MDNNDEDFDPTCEADVLRRSMMAKKVVLGELLRKFKPSSINNSPKANFSVNKSTLRKKQIAVSTQGLRKVGTLIRRDRGPENQMSELVTIMKSSAFKIAEPKDKEDCDLNCTYKFRTINEDSGFVHLIYETVDSSVSEPSQTKSVTFHPDEAM